MVLVLVFVDNCLSMVITSSVIVCLLFTKFGIVREVCMESRTEICDNSIILPMVVCFGVWVRFLANTQDTLLNGVDTAKTPGRLTD